MSERVTVGNIDKRSAAAEFRQRGQLPAPWLRAQQQAKRRLDEFRHGAALPSGFALEFGHDGVIDVQRGFHTGNHITCVAVWLDRITRPLRRCRLQ